QLLVLALGVGAAQEIGLALDGSEEALGIFGIAWVVNQQPRQAGVGADEAVVMHLADTAAIEVLVAEVVARLPRHVALGTVGLGHRRIVETAGSMAGNAAEQVAVVMVLAAQELLVEIDGHGDADLMAGRAELRCLVKRLEERLLVEIRLGLDEL